MHIYHAQFSGVMISVLSIASFSLAEFSEFIFIMNSAKLNECHLAFTI